MLGTGELVFSIHVGLNAGLLISEFSIVCIGCVY